MGALEPWHFLVLLVCFLIVAGAIGGLVWLIVHLSKKSQSPQPPYPGPPYQGGPPPYHQQPPPHSHTGPAYGDASSWDSGGSADGGGGDSGGGDGGGGGGGGE